MPHPRKGGKVGTVSVANERKRSAIAAEKRRKAEYIGAAIWAVIWTFVPLGFAMRVQWACVLSAFAWLGALVFVFTISNRTADLPLPAKVLIQFLQDAGLKIELDSGGRVLVSTPVRDREGQIIAEITRNHWTVSPNPVVWDKNYTADSLEVKDRRGHIVLQLRVLPDRTQIAGEWRDEFGRGARISQNKEGSTDLYIWSNQKEELAGAEELEPLFKYPSSEHWAEWVEKH